MHNSKTQSAAHTIDEQKPNGHIYRLTDGTSNDADEIMMVKIHGCKGWFRVGVCVCVWCVIDLFIDVAHRCETDGNQQVFVAFCKALATDAAEQLKFLAMKNRYFEHPMHIVAAKNN